jgi:hypothetical protein
MDGPDDENPPLGWPKMIGRRPRRKGYSSLTSNYTPIECGAADRQDRGSIASAQRLPAKGPPIRK